MCKILLSWSILAGRTITEELEQKRPAHLCLLSNQQSLHSQSFKKNVSKLSNSSFLLTEGGVISSQCSVNFVFLCNYVQFLSKWCDTAGSAGTAFVYYYLYFLWFPVCFDFCLLFSLMFVTSLRGGRAHALAPVNDRRSLGVVGSLPPQRVTV